MARSLKLGECDSAACSEKGKPREIPRHKACSAEACNCYKIIAKDLGLDKPWEEQGKEETDSLAKQAGIISKKIRNS